MSLKRLSRSSAVCLSLAVAELCALGGISTTPSIAQSTSLPAKPHAVALSATTTAIQLCVGPTTACPSSGYVAPPFQANLPMIYGQTYNGTAVVTPADGGPLGGQTLFYDTYHGVQTLLCTLTTASGSVCQASVGTGAQVGTHVFTDVYMGDTTHTGSTSPPVTIVVAPDTTTATLTIAPGTALLGQPVTLTTTVTGSHAVPAGSVNFVATRAGGANAVALGTAVLAPGTGLSSTAALTTTALPTGSDTVSVSYGGTLNFAAASSTLLLTITQPPPGGFALTVAPGTASVSVGSSTRLTVTVTPNNGLAQGVSLACSNLPAEVTCLFDNTAIAAGGGTTNLVVATVAPHPCGVSQPSLLGRNSGGAGQDMGPGITLPALAGLALLFMPGRRRLLRAWVTLLVVATTIEFSGCATCIDLGTRPATYTFQVTATAADSSSSATQPLTLTVTN